MIIQEPIITSSIDGDNIKTNVSGAYIGYEATSSNPTASNELVFGLGTVGYGNNTVTIGNTSSLRTKLYGSIYEHVNLTGSAPTSYNLERFHLYTVSGSFTASLPATPTPGDSIKIANFSVPESGSVRNSSLAAGTRILIGRNGENIMGYAEDMELDFPAPNFEIMYSDSTKGWVIVGAL